MDLEKIDQLSLNELYEAIYLRELTFVEGQRCAYVDCDGWDQKAWHLLGYKNQELIAYMRAFPQNTKYSEQAFGRVAIKESFRGQGLGRLLTDEGLRLMEETFGSGVIKISAQAYLEKFYESFGFKSKGGIYDEVGIPHIEMIRK